MIAALPLARVLALFGAALVMAPLHAQPSVPPPPSVPPLVVGPAPPAPPAPPWPPWPTVAPAGITASPDWTDYRVYPAAARALGMEGRVRASVLIGSDGVPTDCRIDLSSGGAELDAGTCALFMTMRFTPPPGPDGAPVASRYSRGVVWLLDDPRPLVSSRVDVHFQMTESGDKSCETSNAEGGYAGLLRALACNLLYDPGYYFAGSPTRTGHFLIAARIDAGDGDPVTTAPWPTGTPIAQERVRFVVNRDGDAADCKAEAQSGLGKRGITNQSPCGPVLPRLWLDRKAIGRSGTFETRVYRLPD